MQFPGYFIKKTGKMVEKSKITDRETRMMRI